MRSQAFLQSVVICYQLTESVGFVMRVVVFAFILASNKLAACTIDSGGADAKNRKGSRLNDSRRLLQADNLSHRRVG